MRGRNLTSSSALLATSCLLVASGTVAYHAMKHNKKAKVPKNQREHAAARVIQDAWRRQSSMRTSEAKQQQEGRLEEKNLCQNTRNDSSDTMKNIPTLFLPSSSRWKLLREQEEKTEHPTSAGSGSEVTSVEAAQDKTKSVDGSGTSSKCVVFCLDHTSTRDVSFDDDDESSANSHDNLCLSSPTTNKTITFDHREYRHFRLTHFILLIIALGAMALGFALSQPNNSSLAFEVPSVNSTKYLNGFHLVQSDQQKDILVEEKTIKKHRIEWQSLPLHFGAK